MSSSREFPNPYPDYEEFLTQYPHYKFDSILNPSTGEVSANLKQALETSEMRTGEDTRNSTNSSQLKMEFNVPLCKHIRALNRTFEERLATEVDWNDYSVYTGTSGIALFYLHLMDINVVIHNTVTPATALAYIEPVLPYLKKKRLSFLSGVSGPLAIGSVLYSRAGNEKMSRDLSQRLENLDRDVIVGSNDTPDELLYGRVGYLYALLFLKQHLGDDEHRESIIKEVVTAILRSGKHWAKKFKNTMNFPLYYEWHDKPYIGAAHGFAGILYMLLQARNFISEEDMNNFVKPTIDLVLSLQFPSGNFRSSLGNDADRLVHWCHGAPGVIHLMLLAHEVFSEEKYLLSAKKCSDVIWERGLLRKGYGLCHGVAGNGYAHLRMYQATKDTTYLYRALMFAEWCYDFSSRSVRTPDRPLSLFEGMAGTLYFLTDLLDPNDSAFPAFQLF